MSEIDISLAGCDPDSPETQELRREYRPVSWQARQLCQDLHDLREMDEAEIMRYCGHN